MNENNKKDSFLPSCLNKSQIILNDMAVASENSNTLKPQSQPILQKSGGFQRALVLRFKI